LPQLRDRYPKEVEYKSLQLYVRFDVHRLKERLVKLAQLAQLAQLVLAQYQLVEAKEACPGEENL
jgi:hypothetical protein